MRILVAIIMLAVASSVDAAPSYSNTYGTLVDTHGNISLPGDLQRRWEFLGAWSIAGKELSTVAALHNVYIQPDAVTQYRKTGQFPDGTVIVKELIKTATGAMTTGTVSWGVEVEGWFIMVKDRENRFPDNPLWGDGWGWVLINADAPEKTVTSDYKAECIACHIPARSQDWIYVQGYPNLKTE